ncbi:MAG: hypothetical protein GY910_02795 [bacterium]|nr:hypothetical protein [Deltaproteobacteria bacterium]MCP4903882.1 hypothetical protein [bacterium]
MPVRWEPRLISLEDALDEIAEKRAEIRERDGTRAIVLYPGTQCGAHPWTETARLFGPAERTYAAASWDRSSGIPIRSNLPADIVPAKG